MTQERTQFRRGVLERHGARGADIDALLAYNDSVFERTDIDELRFPLADEPFVAAWERYAEDAATDGAVEVLRRVMVQLSFPIRAGITGDPEYRSVTRAGNAPGSVSIVEPLVFHEPERIRVFIHPTAAGRIPVVELDNRADFELLMRAIAGRNEPIPVPRSTGATIISGYNNWERIAVRKQAWMAAHPQAPGEDWAAEFRRIVPRKDLYQDRFIILSKGPYSGVAANELGLTDAEWTALSTTVRLNHECTHYFTKRVFSSMRNNLLDEVIADFIGIVRARGRYRADWFLRFVGLENYPVYRSGGRLENYRGDPPLGDSAFCVLQSLVQAAAVNLEQVQWAGQGELGLEGDAIAALSRATLEELAAGELAEFVTV